MEAFKHILDELDTALKLGCAVDLADACEAIDAETVELSKEPDAWVRLNTSLSALRVLKAHHEAKGRTTLAATVGRLIAEVERESAAPARLAEAELQRRLSTA